ncbi:MAG: hypothetical protein GF330_10275, partial [Candidatus Eisenbacteria bacterium]|nr:hypothetical protein [Candidatus Eisenbacteria bacterium]
APRLTPGAKAALLAHGWPGNVRELKLVCERAHALWSQSGETRITRELLFPPEVKPPASGPPPAATTAAELRPAASGGHGEGQRGPRLPSDLPTGYSYEAFLEAVERHLITRALVRSGGNRTLATRFLGGMRRTTLIGKMKRLGIFEAASGPAR